MYPQYPPFVNYGPPYRQQPPYYKPKMPYWKPPYKAAMGPMKLPLPFDCLDNYRWAQLKALLSHLGPELGLGRFYTKEVGVQVNPRVDVSVQCSLGPRTLRSSKGGPFLCRATPGQHAGLSIVTPVRFPRTIAVYSRLSDRRLFTLPPAQSPGAQEVGVQPEDPEDGEEIDIRTKRPTFQVRRGNASE